MPAEVETMIYARETPWHALGTDVGELQDAAGALEKGGLLWRVSLEPVFIMPGPNGRPSDESGEVPGYKAVVRDTDQAALGIVGSSYRPVQNEDAFAWADNLVDSGAAKYETAGSLFGGRKVWLSMELPEGISVPGDDGEVKPFLLISNTHDGSTSMRADITMTRVVCANTLQLALQGAKRTFRIVHKGSIEGKLQAARYALGITFNYMAAFGEVAERLALTRITERESNRILQGAFPVPAAVSRHEPGWRELLDKTRFAELQELLRTSPNLDAVRGTAWGAVNAVAEYVDHVQVYKGRRFSSAEVKADAILFNARADIPKQKALEVALSLR